MPALAEVRAAVFPAAQWLVDAAGAATGNSTVSWARVARARSPAFDTLERGVLAILPEPSLLALAADGMEPAAVVEGLVGAGSAGAVLLGTGDLPQELAHGVERARSLALPLLRTPGVPDPASLERSVIGYLVNARAELERQAALLERRLEQASLEGGGLPAAVALIASFLGRAAAIEGPDGALLAVHAPAEAPDTGRAVAAYLRRPRRVALRTPFPRGAGTLALLGEERPSELELLVSERIVALLAVELERGPASSAASAVPRESGGLPPQGPPWVMLVARQLDAGGTTSREDRERLRRQVRALEPPSRLALRGDATSLELRIVAAMEANDPLGLTLAARVHGLLSRPLVVSRPFLSAEERPLAEADARSTLEAAELLGPAAVPGILRADRLPAYRLLAGLGALPDGRRHARALLTPLLSGRSRVDRERLATVRAILDRPEFAEAAASLGVHRNTLAYRIRAIERLTGWQLGDPELRFALGLAVRLLAEEGDVVHDAPVGDPAAASEGARDGPDAG
ncbi:hypothetical protein BH20CHL6_BH20CHL6_15700 [soil metagenome]